jgi:hypothetical protein
MMATPAEAATAAIAESATPATVETPAAEAAPETPVSNEPAPAAKKPVVSEVVRMAREKRRLEARIAELEASGRNPAVAPSKAEYLAELKAKYERDPEAFLEEIAGEDYYALAKRVAAKAEPVEDTVQSLKADLDKLKAAKEEEAKRAAEQEESKLDATTKERIASVAKEIEATEPDGSPMYPTLATLDPEALEEPVALTAYNAVTFAWAKECCKLDAQGNPVVEKGRYVPLRQWSPEIVEARFKAAFQGLESHYAKLRTPRAPGTTRTPEPDRESPTISNNNSSGHADRPASPPEVAPDWRMALRKALKEHGYS